jgi:NAD-dependent dihydropyrimidine dehydrogenase PreA subunit
MQDASGSGFWARLMKPGTRAMYQEGRRVPGYTFFDWLHGYVYARWPYLYIGAAVGESRLARALGPAIGWIGEWIESRARKRSSSDGRSSGAPVTFADTYHGKIVPLESAKRLVTVRQDIDVRELEHVIPYALARDLVLLDPEHIVALDCPCRAVRPNPCLPLDVCLIVGEPFASFVAEHHPQRSRWITQEEAVDILQAEHKRGHVHHAYFKDAMLGRFYAICNCCTCCCGGMQAWRNGVPMLASSGYVTVVEQERCVGCGACIEVCPFDAVAEKDGRAVVNVEACMGCGVCISRCTQGALSLVREPSKEAPLEIDTLLPQAAEPA